MSDRRSKRRKSGPSAYRDQIPLEDDFEVVQARTASLTGPNYTAVGTTKISIPCEWIVGESWAPEESHDFALDPNEDWHDEELEAEVEDVMAKANIPKTKKNRSQASVRPHVYWKENASGRYLDELLRYEGRGDFASNDRCPDCLSRGVQEAALAEYRCLDCFLCDLTCQRCFIRRHRLNPFHNIERWDGSSFVKTTLMDVGLVVHLNHASMTCPAPVPCHENLYVVHTNGVHKVSLSYCGCSREIPRVLQLLRRGLYPASQQRVRTCVTFPLLQLFHMFSLMGKISTYDMYRSVERLTNNTGMKMPPSRYRPTMRCLTQWQYLTALKRGGRGHDVKGANGTTHGGLAVLCPSCPHPGINLPLNWRDAPKELLFLYTFFICMDANFRLKNHLISNFSTDPGLWNGSAYMAPRRAYESYVLSQTDEGDISTCVGFQALAKATTQNTRGLRYTGVAGAMCARSEMVLPNAIANLQKGERYANMDWVFASAIKSVQLMLVAISYDIACQWFINVFRRMLSWPEELRPRRGLNIRPLIPKFHEPAHLDKSHEQYSFNLAEGVGLTDGECPERVWGSHNPLATSTRTTGPGTRDDVLDDHFGHWNWLKYSSMGRTLLRRYKSAIVDRNQQEEAHRGFSASLPLESVHTWERLCAAWDADGFPKSAPNPFFTNDTSISEDEVQDRLGREEEAMRRASGGAPLHKTSATSFLVMGLELEESQRKLVVYAKEQTGVPKSLQTTALRDQRRILQEKIQNWEAVRAVYMPGLLQIQTNVNLNPTSVWNSNPNPEEVELWLPSSLPSDGRNGACSDGLPNIELELRTAQCSNSLQGLRQALRVKTRMVYYKNKNIRGQREGTRSRAIIDRVHKRAIGFVTRYRVARAAKMNIEGPGDWENVYRELRNEDIRGYASTKPKTNPHRRGIWEDGQAPPIVEPTIADDEDSELDLNDGSEGGPLPRKKRKRGTGETRKEISWIWRNATLSVDGNDNEDILRAEWARSRARARRATEEVLLLREEMRRVLEFLEWRCLFWESSIDKRDGSVELKEGLKSYALKQAALQQALSMTFQTLWKTPLADMDDVLQGMSVGERSDELDGSEGDEESDAEMPVNED